jgi:3-oxoacyl-[acyl-carrier-protein] synthase III
MDIEQYFQVIGSGVYFPRREVAAEEIDRRLGKPPGWTRVNIGVNRRFECAPPESVATMAAEAVAKALDAARVGWPEIDLILDCSTSRHRPIPCNAVHVQALFGAAAQGIPCFDVQSTCLGFIVALHVANGLMRSGTYRHILISCSEAPLPAVNWRNAESAALFGDGAAAFILKRSESPSPGVFMQETHSDHLQACIVDGGGHLHPVFDYTAHNDASYRFRMDGKALMRATHRHLPPMFHRIAAHPHVDVAKLHVVPHQGAPRALEMVRRWIDMPEDRFHCHAADYGSIAAASIPITLHQCLERGVIDRGRQVMLLGTSAGYSQAAIVFCV